MTVSRVIGESGSRRVANDPEVIILAGVQGPAGVDRGFAWRGEWSLAVQYQPGDGVLAPDGKPYIALATNINDAPPSSSWSVLAEPAAFGVSFTPAGTIEATNVQEALQELDSELQDDVASLAAHEAASPAHAGTDISYDPNMMAILESTNVQDAIDELAGETGTALQDHLDDTVDAHDASAISVVPAGTIAATDVQSALEEVAGDAADDLAAHVADPDPHVGYILADGSRAFTAQVAGVMPSSPDDLATKDYVDNFVTQVGAGTRSYYLEKSVASSDIGGYFKASPMPSTPNENFVDSSLTGTGDTLIAAFATEPGDPSVAKFPAGLGFRHTHGYVTNGGGGVARLKSEIYKRNLAGTETLLKQSYSQDFSHTSIAEISWTNPDPNEYALLLTDRLVFKMYAARVSGPTTVDVRTYFEGTSNFSYVQTTILTPIQADDVIVTPVGAIAATDLQSALEELDTEKQAVSAKDAASGYCGLDSNARIAEARLGTGTGSSSKALYGDQTWQTNVRVMRFGGGFDAPTAAKNPIVARVPVAGTVTKVYATCVGGTSATVNAQVNTSDLRSSDLTVSAAAGWTDFGTLQNTSVAAGDYLKIEIASVSGTPTWVAIQIEVTPT